MPSNGVADEAVQGLQRRHTRSWRVHACPKQRDQAQPSQHLTILIRQGISCLLPACLPAFVSQQPCVGWVCLPVNPWHMMCLTTVASVCVCLQEPQAAAINPLSPLLRGIMGVRAGRAHCSHEASPNADCRAVLQLHILTGKKGPHLLMFSVGPALGGAHRHTHQHCEWPAAGTQQQCHALSHDHLESACPPASFPVGRRCCSASSAWACLMHCWMAPKQQQRLRQS
jgi:hypothetical protein